MESKKVNIFIIFMVIVMCAFSIFIGVSNRGEDGLDGLDGLSNYELAIKNGLISSDMTEVEYLKSLYGKDGSSVTLEDIYKAYLEESNQTSEDLSYTEFILTYYPDKIVTESETVSLIESTTQSALRSTVDICYSYYMETPIIQGSYSGDKFYISTNNSSVSIGVSAGSGIIYKYEDTNSDGEDDTAYLITNYHVVYCANYSNDANYHVYYDESTQNYFTATYDESKIQKEVQGSFFGTQTYYYLNKTNIQEAPLYTHFLDTYEIYLYGYQYAKYGITATFIGGSADNDIAVLKVEKDSTNKNNELIFSENYKAVDLGDSSELDEGETIVAVGNPLLANTSNIDNTSGVAEYVENARQRYIDALCLTSTSGEISNLSEYCLFQSLLDSTKTTNMRLIRVSSAINAGNSGGGLYGTDGKLVGIVNGKIASSNYDNVGYAIPINIATRIAEQVIDQCDGDKTKTRINIVNEESIKISVSNNSSNSYYDSNTLTWVLQNDVMIENIYGAINYTDLKMNDIIESITVGDKTYEVNNDYDVNDILLSVKTTDTKITFNIIRNVNNVDTKMSIDFSIDESHFIELK